MYNYSLLAYLLHTFLLTLAYLLRTTYLLCAVLLLAAQRALVEDKPTTLSKALDFLVRDFDVKFLWCEPLSQVVTTTPQISPSGGSDAWHAS